MVHLKPPTAGVQLLSINGGGIRGVLPLKALAGIEDTFSRLTGIKGPIQEHFDLAIGTSAGGLIVLGLYINGWSVQETSNRFIRLAEHAFRKPRHLLLSLLMGSRYGADDIEQALKEAFGDRSMLDCSDVHSFGTRIAVTSTTDTSACLFANYTGDRSSDCGMFSDDLSRTGIDPCRVHPSETGKLREDTSLGGVCTSTL
jgi:hypothetical protein